LRHRGGIGADLGEKQHDALGAAGVAGHRSFAGPAALDGAIDEGEGSRGVPDLRSQENGSEHESS